METTALEDYLREMDGRDAVGWEQDEWEQLDQLEQLATAVGFLLGQVRNGGFEQYFANGYGFQVEFLMETAPELLATENEERWEPLEEMVGAAQESWEEDLFSERQDRLNDLDCRFYAGFGAELERRMNCYLENGEVL